MNYRINIYEEVKGQKLFDLLRIVSKKTEVISLERFPNMDINREELERINQEYISFLHKEDLDRRKLFEGNDKFRKNMLDIFDGDKNRVEEYFNESLAKAISSLYEEIDFDPYDEEYFDEDEDMEDDFIEEDYIDSDIESFLEDEDFIKYPEELWMLGEYVDYYGDLLKKELTRITNTTIGPITEVSYFKVDRIYDEILKQMDSIYTWPINIDDYLFENPSFIEKDRIILAISSRDKFSYLNLNDEEYLEFLELDIEHIVDKV